MQKVIHGSIDHVEERLPPLLEQGWTVKLLHTYDRHYHGRPGEASTWAWVILEKERLPAELGEP